MIPAVCEQEAAERLTEATNNFSKAQLVEVIKHWESKYELLDKYAKDLAVKNKHWEVSWPYHQKMVITRIEQREAVIKGLTQANQSLVQKNAGFVRVVNSWQELIHQKDSEIMGLKQEKESLSQRLSVSTNWQEKYNALKEESSNSLEEKKLKLIKEKFQKIEDKKSHLEMSTKDLAEKQEILEEDVKVENNLEEKFPQDQAEEQHNLETVMVRKVKKMEDEMKNPEEKSIEDLAETHQSQAEEVTLMEMKEDQKEKFTEDKSTQDVVETPKVEDEEDSTQDLVETPEVEDEEESTQDLVETPKVEDEEESTQYLVETQKVEEEEEESTQDLVETPEVEDEKKEPEEFTDFLKIKAAEVELQKEESGEEIKLCLVVAVAIKDQSCETTEVEDEKKEPEEFFFLKKTEEVVLQKEKSKKKKKQQRKRVKDIKLEEKFPEAQAE
ncbi:hypothetical protein NQZ68_031469 [Dissostichus eleginoides]|nr:hypothetical protein NQZ68_031469 [Dissostichus eleginoides]